MDNTKIDWCDMSWNPVTGCLHECEYCYARRIAERFGLDFAPKLGDPGMEGATKLDGPEGMDSMLELEKPFVKGGRIQPYPMAFAPTFHRYRLDEPARKQRPRNIFVGSMTDLFGEWVPDQWIADVFSACKKAEQHNFLFLTKNPKRYIELEKERKLPWSDHFWFGTSVTRADDEFTWFKEKRFHWFVSIEPLLERIPIGPDDIFPEWVIIGPETGSRKDKVVPQRAWVEEIVDACAARSIPVFMKSKLSDVWGADLIREFPSALRKDGL